MSKRYERHLPKKECADANYSHENMFKILANREMQIEATTIRIAKLKLVITPNVGKNKEKLTTHILLHMWYKVFSPV